MDPWHQLLLNLCSMASIAAGNTDLTSTERNHLRDLANEVSREVVRQVNAAAQIRQIAENHREP
jgi:hypothetical protein